MEVPKEKSHAKYLIFFHYFYSWKFSKDISSGFDLYKHHVISAKDAGFSQEVEFNAQMHSLGANLQLYANAQIESFIFGGAPVYIKGYVSRIYRSTCSLPTKVIIITSNVFLNVLFG